MTEIMVRFYQFMAKHITKFENTGRGVLSHLFNETVDELIVHVDQMLFMIRYELRVGTAVDIWFLPNAVHKSYLR